MTSGSLGQTGRQQVPHPFILSHTQIFTGQPIIRGSLILILQFISGFLTSKVFSQV